VKLFVNGEEQVVVVDD
jgi:hypothetical protein